MYHQSWSTSCSSSSEAAAAATTRVAAVGLKYSAEERRERIDKYRTKRNQRNFDKKITYACRKTLADSRPRVKGRFARNSDDGPAAEATSAPADESFEVSPHAPLTTSTANVVPEWWPAVQEALATQEQDDAAADELLAAYLGVSSLDLYSPPRH